MKLFLTLLISRNLLTFALWVWTIVLGWKFYGVIGAIICVFVPVLPTAYFAWKIGFWFENGDLILSYYVIGILLAIALAIACQIVTAILVRAENRRINSYADALTPPPEPAEPHP